MTPTKFQASLLVSAIIQTSDGDLVLAGSTMTYGVGNSDMWLVKI
ncbi:MAG: hypothetical protein HeimC2_40490 [Candidatus Heimdallarchaeota archaeon LC_2]|nr:MAG: hypothetical protein HeimC2_40490 [Candidatus Heimdallarchaeota archaeon LC_2]